jgi:hypothetical protein
MPSKRNAYYEVPRSIAESARGLDSYFPPYEPPVPYNRNTPPQRANNDSRPLKIIQVPQNDTVRPDNVAELEDWV